MTSIATLRRKLKITQATYAAADSAAQDAIDAKRDTTESLTARYQAQLSVWKAEDNLASHFARPAFATQSARLA